MRPYLFPYFKIWLTVSSKNNAAEATLFFDFLRLIPKAGELRWRQDPEWVRQRVLQQVPGQ